MFAYYQIPKESTPDVKIPIIYVSLVHEGISPQDAQRLLRPGAKTSQHRGVKEMRSTALKMAVILFWVPLDLFRSQV
jgi:multidrug efflux pump